MYHRLLFHFIFSFYLVILLPYLQKSYNRKKIVNVFQPSMTEKGNF